MSNSSNISDKALSVGRQKLIQRFGAFHLGPPINSQSLALLLKPPPQGPDLCEASAPYPNGETDVSSSAKPANDLPTTPIPTVPKQGKSL